jgi:hypothetical protein
MAVHSSKKITGHQFSLKILNVVATIQSNRTPIFPENLERRSHHTIQTPDEMMKELYLNFMLNNALDSFSAISLFF